LTVTLDDVCAAARLLEGQVVLTPCLRAGRLSALSGAEVWVKFENLQYTASFKDRGALVKLASLSPAERQAGVIAMSAGNHAQGVAHHAKRLGIPATIVMPVGTPNVKVMRTRALGAEVRLSGETVEAAAAHAEELGRERGLSFIPPYDDERIIAGQGTVALEMLAQAPALDCLLVPIGGGGLIAGIAVVTKALRPELEVIGVESAEFPSMYRACRGEAEAAGGQTLADGIAVKSVGKLTKPIVEALVDDLVLVAETEIERAVALFLEEEKSVAEGAGAAGLAALIADPRRFAGRRVGLVLSGGNIDTRLLASLLMRGLVRDGRVASMRIEIADRPGTLAAVAAIIAACEANILEVVHQRTFLDVPAKRADLDVVVETRDRPHIDAVLERLRQAGYAVRLLSEVDL
jgi:threonine dehydratase